MNSNDQKSMQTDKVAQLIIHTLSNLQKNKGRLTGGEIVKTINQDAELKESWLSIIQNDESTEAEPIPSDSVSIVRKIESDFQEKEELYTRSLLLLINLSKVTENIQSFTQLEELKNSLMTDRDIKKAQPVFEEIRQNMLTERVGTVDEAAKPAGFKVEFKKLFGVKGKKGKADVLDGGELEKIKKAYLDLLDNLEFEFDSKKFIQRIARLKQEISGCEDTEVLFSYFYKIVSLISDLVEVNNLNQAQLFKFFQDIMKQISALHEIALKSVEGSAELNRNIEAGNNKLTDIFENGVVEIEKGFNKAQDVKSVKEVMAESLAGIKKALVEKRNNDTENIKALNGKLKMFSDVIVKMKGINSQVQKQNKILELQTRVDPLTLTYNRKGYEEVIKLKIEDFFGNKALFSLGIINIDALQKLYNKYGYQIGDKCVVEISSILKDFIGKKGVISRYESSEFIIVFSGFDQGAADKEMLNLKNRLEKLEFVKVKESFTISISSCAVQVATEDKTPDRILERAREKIFKEKQSKGLV